jgi:hypothetical protein
MSASTPTCVQGRWILGRRHPAAGWIFPAIIALVVGTPGPAAAQDWKRVDVKDGIEVSRRTVPSTGLVAMRGVGTVDAPVWKIASILLDPQRAPEWVDSLKESRVVRQLGPAAYIEYNHFGMPLLVKDREFVSEVQIEVDPAKRSVALVYRPTADLNVPVSRYVRGEIQSGRFEVHALESGSRSELTAEVQCDPKGMLPTWLVNLFQRNWPVTTFERMRAQAAKEDIQVPSAFQDVLSGTRTF